MSAYTSFYCVADAAVLSGKNVPLDIGNPAWHGARKSCCDTNGTNLTRSALPSYPPRHETASAIPGPEEAR